MKAGKIICAVLAVAVLYLCAGGYASAEESFPPLPEALEAMESNGVVTVRTVTVAAWGTEENYYYEFKTRCTQQNLGFIIYPGGSVDPRSYAPLAQQIAKAGYLVVIVKMIGDLAIQNNNYKRASDVIAAYPEITQWVIGGHSLGGVCSSWYVKDFPDKMKGVVLWAAYGSDVFPIQDKDVAAIVISGAKDGLATPAKIEAGKPYLPDNTSYVAIEGGNHTNFGYYDTSPDAVQPGDNPADITLQEQQKLIVENTLVLLDSISGRTPFGNVTKCVDKDGDGYGVGDNCSGFTCSAIDCDDNNSSVYPGAPELCNGKDDDCNGIVDVDNETCVETPCILKIVPKRIYKLLAFLNPFIPFVISAESDSGLVFVRPFEIDWGTKAINDILRIKIGKRIIVGFLFARPLQLESDNSTVVVTYGDNGTEQCGTIEVK